jgi:hypothetical protein
MRRPVALRVVGALAFDFAGVADAQKIDGKAKRQGADGKFAKFGTPGAVRVPAKR